MWNDLPFEPSSLLSGNCSEGTVKRPELALLRNARLLPARSEVVAAAGSTRLVLLLQPFARRLLQAQVIDSFANTGEI
jgi:hypothetical protein